MSKNYNARPIPGSSPKQRKQSNLRYWLAGTLILTMSVYILYAFLRPIDSPRTVLLPPVTTGQAKVNIPWPTTGQAAFGADGYGLLDTSADQTPAPTASVTKVITALVVLQKKPLNAGEQGPLITFDESDVTSFTDYLARDGVVVPVYPGKTLTQYQALQALLIPSANNIADKLVLWAFGSMDAYTMHANAYVKTLGMNQTTVADASGFSPQTISTAGDLVKLGDAALDHPVVAEIVGQSQFDYPEYGPIRSVNSLLGTNGIRGIKTGTTDEAGGCYLAAADIEIGGKKITVITAIMGSNTRPQAMRDSLPLIQSAVSQFRPVHVVEKGQVAGRIETLWSEPTAIIADRHIDVLAWNGTAVAPRAEKLQVASYSPAKTKAGTFSVHFNGEKLSANLYTKDTISGPSAWWRLTNPL